MCCLEVPTSLNQGTLLLTADALPLILCAGLPVPGNMLSALPAELSRLTNLVPSLPPAALRSGDFCYCLSPSTPFCGGDGSVRACAVPCHRTRSHHHDTSFFRFDCFISAPAFFQLHIISKSHLLAKCCLFKLAAGHCCVGAGSRLSCGWTTTSCRRCRRPSAPLRCCTPSPSPTTACQSSPRSLGSSPPSPPSLYMVEFQAHSLRTLQFAPTDPP